MENNGSTIQKKSYGYTADDLLQWECLSDGLCTSYLYVPGKNLVKAKFIRDDRKICARYFYEYNGQGTLIKTIKDDGSTKLPDNFAGVTMRHIQTIVPRKRAPFGLPHVIKESYLDLATKEEKLLRRYVHHYTETGKLIKKDVYDATNTYRYSLEYSYDAHGNLLEETNALGEKTTRTYDANDNLITEKRGNSNKSFFYNQKNELIKEVHNQVPISYQYTIMGNRTATIDSNGNRTSFEYDSLGRLIKIIYPPIPQIDGTLLETSESFSYDCFGNIIKHVDQNGQVTTKEWNLFGKPTKINYPDQTQEQNLYDNRGNLLRSNNRNGVKTQYAYDLFNRIIRDDRYIYEYNAFHLLSQTDYEGSKTTYTYNNAGQLISETKGDKTITYSYDALGRKVKISDPATTSHNTYDLLDRITEEKTSEGRVTTYTYDIHGNCTSTCTPLSTTKTHFDAKKRPVKKVDPEGNTTHYQYKEGVLDPYSVPVSQTIITSPTGIKTIVTQNALGKDSIEEIRDSFNNLLSKKEHFYTPTLELEYTRETIFTDNEEERIQVTHWKYASGQLIKLTEAEGSSTQKITRFTYNAYGQKVETQLPNGILLNYDYDSENRLSRIYSSDNTIDYSYTYNRNDLPTLIQDNLANTQTTRTYDAHSNLIEETLAHNYTLHYAYDAANRLIKTTLPDNSSIHYKYQGSYLSQVERYDTANTLQYTHQNLTHDENGNLIQAHLPFEAGTIQYTYDALNRPTALKHAAFSQQAKQYDPEGNLLLTNNHSYNALNQLISDEDHTYTYDSHHNRTQIDDNSYTFNDLDQVLYDGVHHYEYDLNGNLIRDNNHTYTYDALDRLIQIDDTHFTYDPFNRRLTSNNTHFIYTQNTEIGSIDPLTNTWEHLRILTTPQTEIGTAVAIETPTNTYIPLHDIRGNITVLLSPQGETLETYNYTSFGEEKFTDAQIPWRYSSKRTEDHLIYYGQRFYYPRLGRWLNPDPAGFADGPNLYTFNKNNPLTYVDHFGLKATRSYKDLFFALSTLLLHSFGISYNYTNGQGHFAPHTAPVQLFGPPRELSETRTLLKEEGPEAGLICFMNGVMNDEECFDANLDHLMSLKGEQQCRVVAIHHKTCMDEGFLDDFWRYSQYRTSGRLSNASKELIHTWTSYCNRPGSRRTILQICHSEGAVHVRNALMHAPPEVRNRVDVIVINGGVFIDKALAGKVTHYVSSWDVVPLGDPLGYRMAKRQGTLHRVQAHPDAPWIDHAFTSITMEKILKDSIGGYLNASTF